MRAATFAGCCLLFGGESVAGQAAAGAGGEDSRPDPGSVAPADASPAADPAREVLQAVARFQRGDAQRPLPSRLHGRFHVGIRNAEGSVFQLEVERWYQRSPERLRTSRREQATGAASTSVWSEGRAWFRDDDNGRVIVYSDKPEQHDVEFEQFEQDLRLTRLLLDASVVDALLPRLSDVRSAGSTIVTDLDGEPHDALVVTARLRDELFGPDSHAPPPEPDAPPPRLLLRFVVDAPDGDAFDGTLWSLGVSAPHRADVEPLELRFDLHGRSPSGLAVPGNIRLLAGVAGEERMKLGVAVHPDGTLVFDVDGDFGADVFAEPPKR